MLTNTDFYYGIDDKIDDNDIVFIYKQRYMCIFGLNSKIIINGYIERIRLQ